MFSSFFQLSVGLYISDWMVENISFQSSFQTEILSAVLEGFSLAGHWTGIKVNKVRSKGTVHVSGWRVGEKVGKWKTGWFLFKGQEPILMFCSLMAWIPFYFMLFSINLPFQRYKGRLICPALWVVTHQQVLKLHEDGQVHWMSLWISTVNSGVQWSSLDEVWSCKDPQIIGFIPSQLSLTFSNSSLTR